MTNYTPMTRVAISTEYGKVMEHEKWYTLMPKFKFPERWSIQMMPPFMGAVVRFVVHVGGESISVYLDCYGMLGYFGTPYWEAYPIRDDVGRWSLVDWEEMILEMEEEFKRRGV